MQTPQGLDATHGGELFPVNENCAAPNLASLNLGKTRGGEDGGRNWSNSPQSGFCGQDGVEIGHRCLPSASSRNSHPGRLFTNGGIGPFHSRMSAVRELMLITATAEPSGVMMGDPDMPPIMGAPRIISAPSPPKFCALHASHWPSSDRTMADDSTFTPGTSATAKGASPSTNISYASYWPSGAPSTAMSLTGSANRHLAHRAGSVFSGPKSSLQVLSDWEA